MCGEFSRKFGNRTRRSVRAYKRVCEKPKRFFQWIDDPTLGSQSAQWIEKREPNIEFDRGLISSRENINFGPTPAVYSVVDWRQHDEIMKQSKSIWFDLTEWITTKWLRLFDDTQTSNCYWVNSTEFHAWISRGLLQENKNNKEEKVTQLNYLWIKLSLSNYMIQAIVNVKVLLINELPRSIKKESVN